MRGVFQAALREHVCGIVRLVAVVVIEGGGGGKYTPFCCFFKEEECNLSQCGDVVGLAT